MGTGVVAMMSCYSMASVRTEQATCQLGMVGVCIAGHLATLDYSHKFFSQTPATLLILVYHCTFEPLTRPPHLTSQGTKVTVSAISNLTHHTPSPKQPQPYGVRRFTPPSVGTPSRFPHFNLITITTRSTDPTHIMQTQPDHQDSCKEHNEEDLVQHRRRAVGAFAHEDFFPGCYMNDRCWSSREDGVGLCGFVLTVRCSERCSVWRLWRKRPLFVAEGRAGSDMVKLILRTTNLVKRRERRICVCAIL